MLSIKIKFILSDHNLLGRNSIYLLNIVKHLVAKGSRYVPSELV